MNKNAPGESLGAAHVFCQLLECFLDTRTIDPLAPAQSDHAFPFSGAGLKKVSFSRLFWDHVRTIRAPVSDNSHFLNVFFCERFKRCEKMDECRRTKRWFANPPEGGKRREQQNIHPTGLVTPEGVGEFYY